MSDDSFIYFNNAKQAINQIISDKENEIELLTKQIAELRGKTMTENKQWWKSKTIWVNVLMIASYFLVDLSQYISAGEMLSVAAIINILLRVISKQAITFTKEQ